MRGGHNIKSAIDKKVEGTTRKARDAGRIELIVSPVSEIPPPGHFSFRHVEKWNWVCSRLSEKGLLTETDSDAVQIYVETWCVYEDCAADVRENGTVLWIETSAGKKPITNPAYRHMKDSETTLRMIWDHFGMTPRARMGIKAPEKPKTSLFMELMAGGLTTKKAV